MSVHPELTAGRRRTCPLALPDRLEHVRRELGAIAYLRKIEGSHEQQPA